MASSTSEVSYHFSSLLESFSDQEQRRARIHQLELVRQDKIHHLEVIKRDEESRLLRVQLLKLREENTGLREDGRKKDNRVTTLTRQVARFQRELEASKVALKSRGSQSTKRDLEIDRLKAEVQSLTDSARDLDQALQDKLDLTRELDRIQPEMERLQSQLEDLQAVTTEKNDLQRKVESFEVELNNERRSKQRDQKQENDATIADLRSQLTMAEKSLSCSREELVKAQRNYELELAGAKSFSESLEERVGSLKTKLKASQGELKATRAQLATCRAELEAGRRRTAVARGAALEKKTVSIEPQLSNKSHVQERSFDTITIETPGNEGMLSKQVPEKKHRPIKAVVGEKSSFSITPFLNRTKTLSDESQDASAHEDWPCDGPDSTYGLDRKSHGNLHSTLSRSSPAMEHLPPDAGPKSSAQTPAESDETPVDGLIPKAQSRRRIRGLVETAASRVNEVVPSGDKGCLSTNTATDGQKSSRIATGQENIAPAASEKQATLKQKVQRADKPKMKKRKILRTSRLTLLEDEEDGEALDQLDAKPVLAPAKRLRTHLGGGVKNAFAGNAFSPLKRDRRGANASFLS